MAVVWKHCSGEVCLAISVAAVVVVVVVEVLAAAEILVVAAQEVIGEDLSTGCS